MVSGAIQRRTHFSAPLLIYSIVSMLVAIGAFNSQNNLLYWLFGLSLGMLIVSGVLSGIMLMAIRLEREPVASPDAGMPLVLAYRISSTSRLLPSFALYIREQIVTAPVQRTTDDEAVGAVAAPPGGFVAFVPARGSTVGYSTTRATARGRVRLAGVHVISSFPFGIVRKSLYFPLPASVVVMPAAGDDVDRATTPDRPAAAVAAASPSEAGEETFGLREYQAGDTPRRIAWRSSARTGEMRTRTLASASDSSLVVALRVEPGSSGEIVDRAVEYAAHELRVAGRRGQRIGLVLGSNPRAAARSGRGHLSACLHRLALFSRVAPASRDERASAETLRADVVVVARPEGVDVQTGGIARGRVA